jgi:hypothetical protein
MACETLVPVKRTGHQIILPATVIRSASAEFFLIDLQVLARSIDPDDVPCR